MVSIWYYKIGKQVYCTEYCPLDGYVQTKLEE